MKIKNLSKQSNVKEQIKYKGMIDTIQKIWKNEGIFGFYKGLTPSVLKIFPTSGIFFLAYEFALSKMMDSEEWIWKQTIQLIKEQINN